MSEFWAFMFLAALIVVGVTIWFAIIAYVVLAIDRRLERRHRR